MTPQRAKAWPRGRITDNVRDQGTYCHCIWGDSISRTALPNGGLPEGLRRVRMWAYGDVHSGGFWVLVRTPAIGMTPRKALR